MSNAAEQEPEPQESSAGSVGVQNQTAEPEPLIQTEKLDACVPTKGTMDILLVRMIKSLCGHGACVSFIHSDYFCLSPAVCHTTRPVRRNHDNGGASNGSKWRHPQHHQGMG